MAQPKGFVVERKNERVPLVEIFYEPEQVSK
jgi:hypothetical protein